MEKAKMQVIAVLALCFAAVAAVPSNSQRIVGGGPADIEQYPEMVALIHTLDYVTYQHFCGGVILNQRSILTAAQCVSYDPIDAIRARLGSTFANSGGDVYTLTSAIIHPDYNFQTFDSDIAIVRTGGSIIYHPFTIRAAFVAGAAYNPGDNVEVWAVGWGETDDGQSSEQLQQVDLLTVNQEVCKERYENTTYTITDNMLCTGWLDIGGRDTCHHDNGGPIFHNGVVIGVITWGKGCGTAEFPSFSARISSFAAWIVDNA